MEVSNFEIWMGMISLALAVSLVVIRIMAYMMNNVRAQSSAANYERDFNLTNQSDVYLYSVTTSKKIPKPSKK